MKALVTGATGFIGRHLSLHLERSGWEVHRLIRPRDSDPNANSCAGSRVYLYNGSYESVYESLARSKPDAVFHLASRFLVSHRPEDLRDLVDSNILFGLQLAEAMVNTGVRNLINAGTSWQYFCGEEYRPVNLYAATKQAFEDLLCYYADAHDFHVVSLLLFDTYGPQDHRGKLLSALLSARSNSEPLKLSPGEQLIDLVHVSDVCRAFEGAYEWLVKAQPRVPVRFAVNSDERLSLRALVEVCERVVGKSLAVEIWARPYRTREVMIPPSNLERLPGWKPRIPLEHGLRGMITRDDETNSYY